MYECTVDSISPQLNSYMESNVVGLNIQTSPSKELEISIIHSIKGVVETGKLINIMTRSSRKIQPKNRDPMWKLVEILALLILMLSQGTYCRNISQ